MKTLTIILCLALAQCGLSPAWAQTVEVPDIAPAYEVGGPDAGDLAATADAGGDLAMLLYTVPTAADVDPALGAAEGGAVAPLSIQGGTGRDWQMGVDPRAAAATAEREGWPWYGKAAVVVGCVLVAGLATWAIVEASNKGSHDDDASQHVTIGQSGEGNALTIHYHSPSKTTHGGAGAWE